jgi:hypothetical protein
LLDGAERRNDIRHIQLLLLLAIVSVVVAAILAVILVYGGGRDEHERRRRTILWAGLGASIVLPVMIITLLAYAQPGVCTALGGSWIEQTDACRSEFGGNGANDDGSFSFGNFFDPVEADRR